MADISKEKRSMPMQLTDKNEQYIADVHRVAGVNRLMTGGLVQIEELFGQDMLPDTWFEITNSALSSSITMAITGFSNWTIPVNTTDKQQATEDIVGYLNSDTTFKQYFKARKVLDNPIIHIKSIIWAEYGERATFSTTGNSGTTTNDGYDDISIRGKPASLSFDPRDPRVGILGITGQVTSIPGSVGKLLVEKALNGSSYSMAVDGSSTPVIFEINSIADQDKMVREIRFYGTAAGIKFGQFLSKNNSLTNGIKVEIKSDDELITLDLIKSTEDFQSVFALGQIGFQFFDAAGLDPFLASFKFETPFPLRKSGTFTINDYIKVTIQDNISAISKIEFIAFGFKQDA